MQPSPSERLVPFQPGCGKPDYIPLGIPGNDRSLCLGNKGAKEYKTCFGLHVKKVKCKL